MKKKLKYGFVILHYQALEMTLECIETIFNTFAMKDNFVVVVVDNGSPNKSGDFLKKKFSTNKNIIVLNSDINLGFANGNNLGYKFLKNNFDMDFIIVMNNDVLIKQMDFFQNIEKIYNEIGFYILGPDIYSPKAHKHQSPTHEEQYSYEELIRRKKRAEWRLKHIYRYYYSIFKDKIARFFKHTDSISTKYNVQSKNCCLHGACYIVSKKFIEKREKMFNDKTFMYYEEEILHYEALKNNYTMIYSPELQVIHLEDVSSDSIFNSSLKKDKFKFFNVAKSIDVLLSEMEENNEKK